MFDVNFNYNDICITSVELEDIRLINDFINSQNSISLKSGEMLINYDELYQRFLEYYVGECEFFIKISNNDDIIGIMKGRIEFKNQNEVWILNFLIGDAMRNRGYGSSILYNVIQYFNRIYGIKEFFSCITEKDKKSLKFWENNGYKMVRIVNDFYNFENRKNNMFLMKRSI